MDIILNKNNLEKSIKKSAMYASGALKSSRTSMMSKQIISRESVMSKSKINVQNVDLSPMN